MPNIESSDLLQYAVLWAASGTDNYGNPKVSATKVQIPVRWEVKQTKPSEALSGAVASDVTVYVDRSVAIGSVLWKGKLSDLPSTLSNLYRVVDYGEIPDVKNRASRRVLRLIKHGDSLPETA